jgi:hypothetical protein
MSMHPTKYEYTPSVQIAGMAKDFTTKIEIAQGSGGWTATLHITSSPLHTAGDAQAKLRQELLRLAESLGGAGGK